MGEKVLEVPEVTCDHCIAAIEGAVGALEGVDSVRVSLERKDVTVRFDEDRLELARVVAAIEGEGYQVGADTGGAEVHQIGSKPGS